MREGLVNKGFRVVFMRTWYKITTFSHVRNAANVQYIKSQVIQSQ